MFVVSTVNLYKEVLESKINLKVILIGLLVSILIIGSHLIYWKLNGKVYGLAPSLIFPITCIILPTALYPMVKKIQQKISSFLLISIFMSGILIILFNKYLFNISNLLNIKNYY